LTGKLQVLGDLFAFREIMMAASSACKPGNLATSLPLLTPPDNFPFPFEPYSIQKAFMKKLYESIESGGLAIFESPTGTVCCCDLPLLRYVCNHMLVVYLAFFAPCSSTL
jgi:hypothetical protein